MPQEAKRRKSVRTDRIWTFEDRSEKEALSLHERVAARSASPAGRSLKKGRVRADMPDIVSFEPSPGAGAPALSRRERASLNARLIVI